MCKLREISESRIISVPAEIKKVIPEIIRLINNKRHMLAKIADVQQVASLSNDIPLFYAGLAFTYRFHIPRTTIAAYSNGQLENVKSGIYIFRPALDINNAMLNSALLHELRHALDPKSSLPQYQYYKSGVGFNNQEYYTQPTEFDAISSCLVDELASMAKNQKYKDEIIAALRSGNINAILRYVDPQYTHFYNNISKDWRRRLLIRLYNEIMHQHD